MTGRVRSPPNRHRWLLLPARPTAPKCGQTSNWIADCIGIGRTCAASSAGIVLAPWLRVGREMAGGAPNPYKPLRRPPRSSSARFPKSSMSNNQGTRWCSSQEKR